MHIIPHSRETVWRRKMPRAVSSATTSFLQYKYQERKRQQLEKKAGAPGRTRTETKVTSKNCTHREKHKLKICQHLQIPMMPSFLASRKRLSSASPIPLNLP